jgi:hypothetical protein
MDFDTYWKNLIDRVYHQHEKLQGDEDLFYRLSCIYGETMVDGIEAYFERRFDEYEMDMKALTQCGFANIAADFSEARNVMFGDAPLEESLVKRIYVKLLDEDPSMSLTLNTLDVVYERMVQTMDDLDDYKYQFGLERGFYEENA